MNTEVSWCYWVIDLGGSEEIRDGKSRQSLKGPLNLEEYALCLKEREFSGWF